MTRVAVETISGSGPLSSLEEVDSLGAVTRAADGSVTRLAKRYVKTTATPTYRASIDRETVVRGCTSMLVSIVFLRPIGHRPTVGAFPAVPFRLSQNAILV